MLVEKVPNNTIVIHCGLHEYDVLVHAIILLSYAAIDSENSRSKLELIEAIKEDMYTIKTNY